MKRWISNIALILVGTLAGVVLLEAGLRVADVSYVSTNVWDEYRGTALRPGAEGWWRGEGEVYIRINSDGLRDREHTKTKPANTIRMAVLGDSYAEASQLPIEQTFWSLLERELVKCPAINGQTVEVINFGVSGYGTAQELMTLRHRVWDYSPDIVILAFLSGNDVRNNSRALDQDPMKPYFTYSNGKLVLDASFRNLPAFRARQTVLASVAYWALDYSRVLQVINQAKNIVRAHIRQKRHHTVGHLLGAGGEIGLDHMVYSEPRDPLWQEAWRVTEGLLMLMRDEIRERGAEFLVVTLSNGIQVHRDQSLRQRFMEQLAFSTLFYPDLRIKALGKREGFNVLNLAPIFQAYADEHEVFLHGFGDDLGSGHWNVEGHRLAGELIAKNLCEEVLSKRNLVRLNGGPASRKETA